MMIQQVAQTALAFQSLRSQGELASQTMIEALDTPYPYAHYLATTGLAAGKHKTAIPRLIAKLDAYVKAQNTVGFWWCCEALAHLGAKEAAPVLARYAVPTNPPNTFGPDGMPVGYIASKALAQLIGDAQQPDVAKLLASDNAWLRAGALHGLAEAGVPGIESLLRRVAAEDCPAAVRQEAEVQQRRLLKPK
jgi:hypothetical protein